eukprot:404772-Rhodomonas_salina.1
MTGATPISTPMEPNTHLSVSDCPASYNSNKEFVLEYKRIIGALLYLANLTRPGSESSVRNPSNWVHISAPAVLLRAGILGALLRQPCPPHTIQL